MKFSLIPSIVALFLALSMPSNAAEKVTEYDRFQLWDGCTPADTMRRAPSGFSRRAGNLEALRASIVLPFPATLARFYRSKFLSHVYSYLSAPSLCRQLWGLGTQQESSKRSLMITECR